MRVWMIPSLAQYEGEASGIATVVRRYHEYFPKFGIELVDGKETSYDLKVVHAGMTGGDTDIAMLHGVYFTADYSAPNYEYRANANVIDAARHAKVITVPSHWVAEIIARDMRVYPEVVPHGVKWQEWQHNEPNEGYVLWNKNRSFDVCTPRAVVALARKNVNQKFVTTFLPREAEPMANIHNLNGTLPFEQMRKAVQRCSVYLATVKETFGIGTLEAMAAGKPVLGYRHGGVLDTVQHGVNGYLATPGDENDLNEGLAYCIAHAKTLGDNGREMARAWTWEKAVQRVLEVYQMALKKDDATYSVIIPCYNYADKVGRAIESALAQTIPPQEVIVVDDGSADDTGTRVRRYTEKDNRVRLIQQSNGGVATARNAGIYASKSKYIIPLDADDAIDPRFAAACLPELESDRSLGVCYSGLWYIKPDGSEGLSPWPGQWNFDEQLKGKNQVPTCAMLRREMLLRLGGYRQRFAPGGAGSEDAELFLRAGAFGWKAKKVTDAGLFLYSWLSGRVSGDREYKETNWTDVWHPWCKDGHHPFASYASPKRLSHPVHQYDMPDISVVIPVGPNHIDHVIEALDSLEAQTFRRWEAIVVWDVPGFWDDPQHERIERIQKAYPYVKFRTVWGMASRVGDESQGAGQSRNLGASFARGSLLLFLDADDWLYPEALEKMFDVYVETQNAVYTDYVAKAYIKDLNDPTLAKDIPPNVLWRDEKTGETVIAHKAADFDCDRAIQQPIKGQDPYLWCNITVLFPTQWHREINGFDAKMESWEDIDYWWRLARAGHCFTRLTEPLMVYRFYTGTRRQLACPEGDAGLTMARNLLQYMRNKYDKEGKPMGCGGCGRSASVSSRSVQPVSSIQQMTNTVSDDDVVMVQLTNGNSGEIPIVGHVTKTFYGMRAHGDTFLMKKEDQAVKPNVYSPIVVNLPQPEKKETPPPEPIVIEEYVADDQNARTINLAAILENMEDIQEEVWTELPFEEDVIDDQADELVEKVMRKRGRPKK